VRRFFTCTLIFVSVAINMLITVFAQQNEFFSAGETLTGNNARFYSLLAEHVEKLACGEETDAVLTVTMADLGLTELAGKLREIQETVQTWFGNAEDIMSYINLLRREGGIIEQHNARITALEKIVGIVSVVKNN